jgi:hypothetical protein
MNPSTVHQTQQDKVLDLAVLVRHLLNNLDRVRAQLPKRLSRGGVARAARRGAGGVDANRTTGWQEVNLVMFFFLFCSYCGAMANLRAGQHRRGVGTKTIPKKNSVELTRASLVFLSRQSHVVVTKLSTRL